MGTGEGCIGMTSAANPRRIVLMDTTLRDGEQTQGVSFSVNEKVSIARALLQTLGVDRIEVASACVSEGEREAVAKICAWASEQGCGERVEVLGFVDYKRSVDWIHGTGCRVVNLLTKGSEKHCRTQLGKTLEQHLADIERTVEYAGSRGMKVNVYLEDWSNGYRDSRDYVFGLVEGMRGLGIAHFMLPDTLGALSPQEVTEYIGGMRGRFPELRFDFHPHNDYGLATANVLAAVEAGVDCIHCTVNCLGERAGNVSLAEVAVVLRDKAGVELAIDESRIAALSGMVENFSGKRIAANTPVTGADVFTQTAGIHADGDLKGNLYVSRLRPERFDRKRTYALGKMSGKASLINNLDELGISLSAEEQAAVLARIVELGDSKHVITTDDLPFIIADVLEDRGEQHMRLLNCYINTGLNVDSTASVRAALDGEELQASGVGNGGFDAFMDALEKILRGRDFAIPELVDFEVRIPRGGQTDALTECFITWQLPGRKIRTRGVDSNQVLAAVKASLRMINLQLSARQRNSQPQDRRKTAY